MSYVDFMDLMTCEHLQPCSNDRFKIEKFEVTKDKADLYNMSLLFGGQGDRQVRPGTYTRLVELKDDSRVLWMSDTSAERKDHWEPLFEIEKRGGDVLIAGLGLGMIASAALKFKHVTSVTVIEIDPGVIDLIAPQLNDPRLTIIEADIFKWKPPVGAHYSVAYFDVWPTLCTDNLMEYDKVKRRFAKCSDVRLCWGQDTLRYHKRQEYRNRW